MIYKGYRNIALLANRPGSSLYREFTGCCVKGITDSPAMRTTFNGNHSSTQNNAQLCFIVANLIYNNQVEENEMGEPCSKNGREEERV
jgi:hypothetical protein